MRLRRLAAGCAGVAVVLLVAGTLGAPARVEADPAGLRVFFGNLHSHTKYSDGSGTPKDAYAHARTKAKLDFLAVTEHNHKAAEGTGEPDAAKTHIARDWKLYVGPAKAALIPAATTATVSGKFVALYGQEFSTISAGNHVNVFDVGAVIDETVVKKGDFATLMTWLEAHPDTTGALPILMLNHPGESTSPDALEYGRDDFGGDAAWLAKVGGAARLIEILNGPGTDPGTGFPFERVKKMERDYLEYLKLGFHVGPTGDQDNHWRNWGTSTDVRTGVVATALTKTDVMSALRARHVYATSDRNLRAIFRVNGALCGDRIAAPAVGSELAITFSLTDDDEDAASYRIEVWSGTIGGASLAVRVQAVTREGDVPDPGTAADAAAGTIEEVRYEGGHQFVFFKIIQDGEDAPSDFVWTAPVWLEPTASPPTPPGTDVSKFVASKKSAIYHVSAECKDAKAIKAENKLTGAAAAKDRTPHEACPRK